MNQNQKDTGLRRSPRRPKPTKYHTDLDLEALGYTVVSTRRANKKTKTSKKGRNSIADKKTKVGKTEMNSELVDYGGKNASHLVEPNRTNPNDSGLCRSPRRPKPTRCHTDLDLEALGYTVVSTRRANKKPKTSKKGRNSIADEETKIGKTEMNSELVDDGGKNVSHSIEPNRTNSNDSGLRRSPRRPKPTKYHTNLDLEALGYTVVSTRRANKKPKTSKKGRNSITDKKTKGKTGMNSEFVDYGGKNASHLVEPNQTNPKDSGLRRSPRRPKPTKYHTNLDLEALGYTVVSTRRANKKPKTSKKGRNSIADKKTKGKTGMNSEFVDYGGKNASHLVEPNQTNPKDSDRRRSLRTSKPVKWHTDLDLEALGYIPLSTGRDNKKLETAKKGRSNFAVQQTKKSNTDMSPELVNYTRNDEPQILKPVVQEHHETNRTKQNNFASPSLEPCDNTQVEIIPLPTTSTLTESRGRKRVGADSDYENLIPIKINRESRAHSQSNGTRHVNKDESSVLASNLEHVHRRSLRTQKPVKHHTDLDPKVLGYTLVSTRGANKKPEISKKGRNSQAFEQIKKRKTEVNPKLGPSVLEPRIVKEQHGTSRTNQNNVDFTQQPSISQKPERLNGQNEPHDFTDSGLRPLNRSSNSSSTRRLIGSVLEINNETDCDNVRRRSHPTYDDDFVRSIDEGFNYVSCISRAPPVSSFIQLGDLHISETIVDPNGSFTAGYLRLDFGCLKKPTVSFTYSFIYGVLSGAAHVQLKDKWSIVKQGDFFCIPRGLAYSIKNASSQRDLLLHYTKIRGCDA